MAVSPLVPSASAEGWTPNDKCKLSSSSLTPNGKVSEKIPPSSGTAPDLAEQMNEEEKHKYVKGIDKCSRGR
jgi:cyclin-dependent kinase 7